MKSKNCGRTVWVIVSEPGHDGRSYQVLTKTNDQPYCDPDTWASSAPRNAGPWWLEWVAWLAARSVSPVAPPVMGLSALGIAPLGDAPGTYVMQE